MCNGCGSRSRCNRCNRWNGSKLRGSPPSYIPLPTRGQAAASDRMKGKLVLFALFSTIIFFVVLFFSFMQFYSVDASYGPRDDALWREVRTTSRHALSPAHPRPHRPRHTRAVRVCPRQLVLG